MGNLTNNDKKRVIYDDNNTYYSKHAGTSENGLNINDGICSTGILVSAITPNVCKEGKKLNEIVCELHDITNILSDYNDSINMKIEQIYHDKEMDVSDREKSIDTLSDAPFETIYESLSNLKLKLTYLVKKEEKIFNTLNDLI